MGIYDAVDVSVIDYDVNVSVINDDVDIDVVNGSEMLMLVGLMM